MDATGLALAVITVLFLGWLLAPSRRSPDVDTDVSPGTE